MAYQLLKKAKSLPKKIHNLHHLSSFFMELFVMPYLEAFLTLAKVKIYVTFRCTKVGSNFHFFFDGHVTNFKVPFGITKNKYMVCLKF